MNRNIKLACIAIMVALALILSYVEALIPFNFGIPGAKLGLANTVVLTSLFFLDTKSAICVSLLRITLSSLLFGTMLSFAYSIAGGMLSLFGMVMLMKITKFNIISISVVGGVLHNVGQLAIALLVLETAKLAYYIPFLILTGVASGIFVGIISGLITKKLPAKFISGIKNKQ